MISVQIETCQRVTRNSRTWLIPCAQMSSAPTIQWLRKIHHQKRSIQLCNMVVEQGECSALCCAESFDSVMLWIGALCCVKGPCRCIHTYTHKQSRKHIFKRTHPHTHNHTDIHIYPLTSIPTYVLPYVRTYLPTNLPTYLPTHLPTYSLTLETGSFNAWTVQIV